MARVTPVERSPAPTSGPGLHAGVVVPADDGVELVGDLYLPWGDAPAPGVLQLTPYGAHALRPLGELYAARGMAFLALDVRGRYRSAGRWEPLARDRADGHAAIRWLASHPRCTGAVGMRGHSYGGTSQLLAAVDAPPALRALCAVGGPADPFDNVPFQGGAWHLGDLRWLLEVEGRWDAVDGPEEELGFRRFGDDGSGVDRFGRERAQEAALQDETWSREQVARRRALLSALRARPFGDVDLRLGVRSELFRAWRERWAWSAYWEDRAVLPHVARIHVPTLLMTGWWDDNGRGATRFHRALRERGGLREGHRLVIGAWDHALRCPDVSDLPERDAAWIARAAQRDDYNDELAWFDHHLRGAPRGPSIGASATVFVTGAHRWVDLPAWPPVPARTPWFLAPGRLGPRPAPSAPTAWTFDPDDPTPSGPEEALGARAPLDVSAVSSRADVACFESAPVEAPVALVGEVDAVLYVACDAPDVDVVARLSDVHPDGRAIELAEGILRARFREGYADPRPLAPGEIARLELDLWHVGHVLRPGHRLRVDVASASSPRFDVNPCTGGDLVRETAARRARVTLHHDPERPSAVRLPIVPLADLGLDEGG